MKQPTVLAPFRAIRHGFTLVELSIVLVILGLLTGGILAGQSMVHSSQLRGIIKQYNDYYTATTNFRDQYGFLPGDFPNATPIWGKNAAGLGCLTENSGIATCDGNGDGIIKSGADTSNAGATRSVEEERFFQHMANAGLIASINLTVTPYPVTVCCGQWLVQNLATSAGNSGIFAGTYDNFLMLSPSGPLTPTDLWNLDKKMDDGLPATGKMVVSCPNILTCTTASSFSDLTGQYQLSGTDTITTAQPIWRQQF